ncbi:MAG TPA: hypothetical protein VF212_03180 [Longimicrobiales bacterium]
MTTTPDALGDSLARLVWANFSDFLDTAPVATATGPDGDAAPDLVPEELLILFLWVHTRACQQALGSRVDADTLKATLDALHRAVFEDMEAHGTARAALPLFEQRISARYAEYYAAAGRGEGRIGEVAARRVSGKRKADPAFSAILAEATLVAAGPLRDYLADIDLVH